MKRYWVLPVVALCGAMAVGLLGARERQPSPLPATDKSREADTEAIVKSSRDFEAAFAKGDSKAIAALWTDQGECEDADGEVFQGREAIEQAYVEAF